MKVLKIGNIPLPEIVVVEPRDIVGINTCKENGLPYIIWSGSKEDLIKVVLYPTLKKMFPYINWEKIFSIPSRKRNSIIVHRDHIQDNKTIIDTPGEDCYHKYDDETKDTVSIADEYNYFDGGAKVLNNIDLDDYIGDECSQVNIETLQELNLLPSFIGDISNCIKKNLVNNIWTEGYNKKLGVPIGNFNATNEAKNLMILDISGSIPRGIAATMIALIDTLRTQANADLIITASHSEYYPLGSQLPSPEDIRKSFGLGNECAYFCDILSQHILGKTWGNIIVFGDNDCPEMFSHPGETDKLKTVKNNKAGTVVNALWNYHTQSRRVCGYGLWAEYLTPKENIHYNTDWCNFIYRN